VLNIRHRRRSLSSTAAAGTPRAEALASGREVRVPATLAFGNYILPRLWAVLAIEPTTKAAGSVRGPCFVSGRHAVCVMCGVRCLSARWD